MRKLISLVMFGVLLGGTLIGPATSAQGPVTPSNSAEACCNCTEVKSACRLLADTSYNECIKNTARAICWMISENEYQTCVYANNCNPFID